MNLLGFTEEKPCKILLIEDNENEAFIFVEYLKSLLPVSAIHLNRVASEEFLNSLDIDIAFIDLTLEHSTPEETIQKVSPLTKKKLIPIIVITSLEDYNLMLKSGEFLYSGFLLKGEGFKLQFLATILNALGRAATLRKIRDKQRELIQELIIKTGEEEKQFWSKWDNI